MKFEPGDVCYDKANTNIKIVIIRPFKTLFRRTQKYKVSWYNQGMFKNGSAYECELETK